MLLCKFLSSKSRLVTINKYLFARNLKPKQFFSPEINDALSENTKKSQQIKKTSLTKESEFQSQNPSKRFENTEKPVKKAKTLAKEAENSKITDEKAETFESLLKSFNENMIFDVMIYLRFLKESLRSKKNIRPRY